MASGLDILTERRETRRVAAQKSAWSASARLRPGAHVTIINLSAGGALVECAARLQPGTRTELHLYGVTRRAAPGHISRCRVIHLDPLRYEAAIVFDRKLDAGL